jgi:hypothetical protein
MSVVRQFLSTLNYVGTQKLHINWLWKFLKFLLKLDTYSNITDDELDMLVMSAQRENPSIGIRMLKGYLHSKGHRTQRERIRQSLLRTDPSGAAQRWKQAVKRRTYNVNSPLALWHIDGNHKLIRYCFNYLMLSRVAKYSN